MIEEAYSELSHEEKRLMAKSAGRTIGDAPKAIVPLYKVMKPSYENANGKTYKVNEEAFFTALSIRCMFEKTNGPVISPEDFVKKGRESNRLGSVDSYDRRIAALMDNTEKAYFSMKLAKLMAYTSELVSDTIPDCEQIYRDIVFIDNPDKSVQRKWARKIYS